MRLELHSFTLLFLLSFFMSGTGGFEWLRGHEEMAGAVKRVQYGDDYDVGGAQNRRLQENADPTPGPTPEPTPYPTFEFAPTGMPSMQPSSKPSGQPSSKPSVSPTGQPSGHPTLNPSSQPTSKPSGQPSGHPTLNPSSQPTSKPTTQPSRVPTGQPTLLPTSQPSSRPSGEPTGQPSCQPTSEPSAQPSSVPSMQPTGQPTGEPTTTPSVQPTGAPTAQPTSPPTGQPSSQPTRIPTGQPTGLPSGQPTGQPSSQPTMQPTGQPSTQPTTVPTSQPSMQPTSQPSCQPTTTPTSHPTTSAPTSAPSSSPTMYPFTSPPTNKGVTTPPTSIPTVAPTRKYDDYMYRQIYGLHQVAVKDLEGELRPDNGSVVGSIYYDYLDYKGMLVFGGCDDWTDFRTKAVNLPFDNLYPSYVKARFAIENYATGDSSSSIMEADCAEDSVLIDLFAALKDTDVNKEYTGRCVATDGDFHDWRVYTCNGHTIMCVDCKIACSDQACPGVHPSIVRSCREPGECIDNRAAMAAFRFDIAQTANYPAIQDLASSSTDTSVTVTGLVNQTSIVYCAAIKYNNAGSFPGITSVYRVKKPPVAGNGVGYTQVTGVIDGTNTPISVTIENLSPATSYRVLCYTEDAFQHGMDLNAVRNTYVDAVTTCCAQASIQGLAYLTAGSTGPVNTAESFFVRLDAVPGNDTSYSLGVSAASAGDGCDSSKVGLSGTTLPTVAPASFTFLADTNSLSLPFSVSDNGEGCFKLALTETSGDGTFTTADHVLHIVTAGSASPAPPALETASFSSSGIFIYAEFSEATDRAAGVLIPQQGDVYSPFDCDLVVSFSGSGDARCQWTSTSSLRAKLPITPSSNTGYASVGDIFTVAAGTVRAACPDGVDTSVCDAYSANGALTASITAGDAPIVPLVSISTAGTIGLCDNPIIDPSQSSGSGGRAWSSISWIVQGKDSTDAELANNLTEFSSWLNTWHSTTTRYPIAMPRSIIDPDDDWVTPGNRTLPVEYDISVILTLTNFLGQSSTGSTTFRVSSADLVPNVRIYGPVQFSRYPDQALTLFASATVPSCNSTGGGSAVSSGLSSNGISVSFAWGTFREFEFLETLPSLSRDPRMFRLGAYSLSSGYRYSITVVATLTFGDYSSTAESQVVVDVQARGVQAVITGGENRTISLADDYIYVDASDSRDLDYPIGYSGDDYLGLNYSWSCIEYSPTYGNDCGVTLEGQYLYRVRIDNRQDEAGETGVATTFLEAGKAYLFTVDVYSNRDSTATDSASTIAYVIGSHKGPAVDVTLSELKAKYNPDQRIRINATISANQNSDKPVVMQWACADIPDIANYSLSPYQTKLQFGLNDELLYEYGIKANMLSEGHTYSFVLTAGYMDVYKDTRNSTDQSVLLLADSRSLTSVTLDVVINNPPSNGEFIINPSSGVGLNTTFGFDTYGWVDDEEDLPLSYGVTCYRINLQEDATIVSTMQEVQYFEAVLSQGHDSQNYEVTCVLTAQDVFELQASLSQVVTVNRNPWLDRESNINGLGDFLTTSLADSFSASDALGVWRTVTGVAAIINEPDCSSSPTCWQLKRNRCSRVDNTCGECYDGYVGISGHWNSPCVLSSSLPDGEECSADIDCFSGTCEVDNPDADDDDQVKYCRGQQKACPNDCGTFEGASTGNCVYYDGFAIGRTIIPEPVVAPPTNTTDDDTSVGPGNGIDDDYVFIDPNTSAPTFAPTEAPVPFLYTAIGNCSANNVSCSAVCECEDGYWGMACGVSNSTIREIRSMREEMCTALLMSLDIQDTSVDVAYARIMTVKDILFDLTQISDSAMTNCTQVLIQTIAQSPVVASDDAIVAELTVALSHVLQVGLMLDPIIRADVLAALADLQIAKQQNMAVGEDPVTIETPTFGTTVGKVRFGGGNNIGQMTFSPPVSETASSSGILLNSLSLSQRTDYDETQYDTDDYRFGSNLVVDTNATLLDDDAGVSALRRAPSGADWSRYLRTTAGDRAESEEHAWGWWGLRSLYNAAMGVTSSPAAAGAYDEVEEEGGSAQGLGLSQTREGSRDLAIVAIVPPAGYNLSTYNCTNNPNCTIVTDEELAGSGYSTVIGITVTQFYAAQSEEVFHNSTPIQLKAKFYEGQTAAEQAVGNATITLVMQNYEEEPYNVDPVETVLVQCFPSKDPYEEVVTCANGLNSTVTCVGDYLYGQRVVSCPGYVDAPRCATYDSTAGDFEVESRCKATAWTSFNTTCECNLETGYAEDQDSRRLQRDLVATANSRTSSSSSSSSSNSMVGVSRHLSAADGNVLTYEFSSFMVVDATGFESFYEMNGVKFIEEVRYNDILLFCVFTMMFMLFAGLFFFVRWDLRDVFTYDDRYNDSPKVIPTMRTFDSFFAELLPHEFADIPWYLKFTRKLFEEHDWLVMLVPGGYDQNRDLRSMKWLMVMGKLFHFMLGATFLAQLIFTDDGTCQSYTTASSCTSPKGVDGFTNLCVWRAPERSCGFSPYVEWRFIPVVACTILIVLITAVPEKFHRFLVQQTKRFFDRAYFGEGAEQTIDNELGDEMKDIQGKSGTILRAARLTRMKEEIDYVTPEEELTRLIQVTSRFHWFPQKQFPSATNNLFLAIEREMRNIKYNAEEIGDPRSASELFYHAIASSRGLIVKKLQRSRRRAEVMKYRLMRMKLDLHRDDYLLRKFIADSLPGYRRLVATHFFFAREEARESLADQPYWVLKASVGVLVAYWLVGLFYIVFVGRQVGSYGVTLWVLAVISCLAQDIFLLQPLRIWAQFVLFTYSASDELLALYECLRSRAKTLMTRQKGIITNTRSLVQHFNPACRAARMFPHLPSSRLIISINDFDLPVNHRLKNLLPDRRWDAMQPSLAGVEGENPAIGTLAVLSRASPLLADLYSLVALKGYQAMLYTKDRIIAWAFASMAAFLFILFSLPEPGQNATMEILLTFGANLFFAVFFFANQASAGALVALIIITGCALLFYFWYDERQKLLERKDKKRRIAVRDAQRARKYYKQYMESSLFDPGAPAREQGIFFKEIGPFHKDTYQEGTGLYDDEESKLADSILKDRGFLPFTATIAAPPLEEDFGPDGKPKISAVVGGGLLAPEFYDNKAYKKPDPKKKGKREPYGVFSNAHAAPANKVVPVAQDVDDVMSIYSQETQQSKEEMLRKMRADLEKQYKVESTGPAVQEEGNTEEVKGAGDGDSSTEVGILDSMTRGVSTLIGGVLPISWGRLKGKTPGEGAGEDEEGAAVVAGSVDGTSAGGSASGGDLKQGSLMSVHSTKFKPLEGVPLPSEKAVRHKKKHRKKRMPDGTVVSALETAEHEASLSRSQVSMEVAALDEEQRQRQNTMHGSLKSSLAVALVAAKGIQGKEKQHQKGMPIDGEGHMIAVESQPDMAGAGAGAGAALEDDDGMTVGTFMSSQTGPLPRSVHRNTERKSGDRKELAAEENLRRSRARAAGDSSTVGSSAKSLSRYEKADGPGSVALDEKLSSKKYEESAGGQSSTDQLMLPLREMLHELASLKVLNPEMASETLVAPGASRRDPNVMTTHAIKPVKRSKKLRGDKERDGRHKSTTIIKAGAASIASSAASSDAGSFGGSGPGGGMAAGGDGDDDDASVLTEIDLLAGKDPMMEEPRAVGGGAKSSHQIIKEKGRIMEYKTIRSRKKKVVDRLLPSGYPGSPMAGEAAVPYDPGSPPPRSGSPGGYAKSQKIDRSDKGPAAILPWRDETEKKEIDVEHMVAPTGVYFVNPTDAPKPVRPRPPPKVSVRHNPAGQVENEHLDAPKHPLFT